MLSRGVPEWYAESCMKIGYLFPKAQIVSYVINALRIGWYKVYHPTAFYAAYFTVYGTDTVAEAMLRGKKPSRSKSCKFGTTARISPKREKNGIGRYRSPVRRFAAA